MAKSLRESRKELQKILEGILGSRNVYFQPPENLKVKFPCIVFELSSIDKDQADNIPYVEAIRYSVMYVSRTPDDEVFDKLRAFPYTWFERFYVADNLNHYIFRIYN